ncbi:ATP-dependent helicase HrpB [Aestuariimicrobium sp. Y1814]|uniref:ATP-dependent helicase HrpB n=1 Tax=Aestuariimicrobium sp. Y1814 TaxID=3418742 RepID=UPI003DA73189
MRFDLEVIGTGLPVAAVLADLEDALATRGAVVVQAPPGTGKTTLVPPAVANRVGGRVVVTQPRRVAARAAARRLAELSGVRLGAEVGFVVRGEQQAGNATRVEFCTAGVLLRRLLSTPDLPGIDAVVLDEVHERALETDLAFAMLVELRQLRPDLQLVVMSATLDAQRWADLLDGAPVVAVAADLHPLTVRWAPSPAPRLDARGVTPALLDHLADQAEQALASQPAANAATLVFAPGARECDQVVQRLRDRGVSAEALHGSLDIRSQDRVLRGDGGPRVVVATSVAESSLTVPGVRAVVDSGLSREPRFDSGRGMTGLVTVSEARASAEQRAGRARRLGPGLVVRCFPEGDWAGLRRFSQPEILTADLTQAALDLAVWGSPAGEGLALPDPPPVPAMSAAIETLTGLGALDERGHATDLGRRLARMPVEPRLGRALLRSAPLVGSAESAEVVALVAGDARVEGADLVAAWRAARSGAAPGWRREADRLVRLVDRTPRPAGLGDDDLVARVVAAAFPDRVARRRGAGDEYLLASGTGVDLPRGSRLQGQEWLAVADMARVGERALVRSAAPLTEDDALAAASALVREETTATWDGGRVTARRTTALGAITLTRTPVPPTAELGRAAVRRALSERGLRQVLGWGEGTELLRRRLALLHRHADLGHLRDPWPGVDDASLVDRVEEWLGPELDRLAGGTPAGRLDLTSALRRLLPWPAAARLDELVPERLEVPTGSRIRLDYPEDPTERVVLAVKLQECFGWTDTPRIVDGHEPVLLHLLSPAQRPLAVTDDLASFWVNAYPQVRAENRGRYSKHPWPEDPLTAPPRRGTKNSGR